VILFLLQAEHLKQEFILDTKRPTENLKKLIEDIRSPIDALREAGVTEWDCCEMR